ncbi:MAG: amidohydrolase family protein [Oscillospiraceae bacterium]|nr:amidohydrolase family protein [Oscillospiraceae bacterium]
MKRRIIDSHAHLGDIFHENKNITFKTNIKKGSYEDPFIECERSGYNIPLIPKDPTDLINAGQSRSWEWTLENCSREMDEAGIDFAVMLPIWPNTTFEEYLAASKLDPRIIPFTSADFSLDTAELAAKLRLDIDRGAKGLKLHPTIQNMPLDDPKTVAAVRVFTEADLPVITHTGSNPYYVPGSPWPTNPANSEPAKIWAFCRAHPDTKIICAHCGGSGEAFIKAVGDLKNVYTDTTMCNRVNMQNAVSLLGPERLLFGSDVPFGSFKPSVEEMELAFADRPDIADMCFYSNMARLIHMD